MSGGQQDTFRTVVQLLEEWRPREAYGHEREFQSELQDYLEDRLNNERSGGIGAMVGGAKNFVASTECGTSRGDVVVDDVVGF